MLASDTGWRTDDVVVQSRTGQRIIIVTGALEKPIAKSDGEIMIGMPRVNCAHIEQVTRRMDFEVFRGVAIALIGLYMHVTRNQPTCA